MVSELDASFARVQHFLQYTHLIKRPVVSCRGSSRPQETGSRGLDQVVIRNSYQRYNRVSGDHLHLCAAQYLYRELGCLDQGSRDCIRPSILHRESFPATPLLILYLAQALSTGNLTPQLRPTTLQRYPLSNHRNRSSWGSTRKVSLLLLKSTP